MCDFFDELLADVQASFITTRQRAAFVQHQTDIETVREIVDPEERGYSIRQQEEKQRSV